MLKLMPNIVLLHVRCIDLLSLHESRLKQQAHSTCRPMSPMAQTQVILLLY
jgi:hypothetical protein